ncbi:MAG: NTP transferase domain-containing protein [Holophaga sp.]|nr:NTP transferase domain-containing protein [Holophaga sp.]
MPLSSELPAAGLLLLTGGQGRRLGGPKHRLAHPGGTSWGGHLVRVFEGSFPGGPVQLLGEGLPDRPDLTPMADPRQGPGAALRHWAGQPRPRALRWWVAACDQVRWTPETLSAWHQAAAAADPQARAWVLARHGGRIQPLGGFLADALVPGLCGGTGALMSLVDTVPCLILDSEDAQWLDVDTPEALQAFLDNPGIRWPEGGGASKLGTPTFEVP